MYVDAEVTLEKEQRIAKVIITKIFISFCIFPISSRHIGNVGGALYLSMSTPASHGQHSARSVLLHRAALASVRYCWNFALFLSPLTLFSQLAQ